MVSIMLTYGLLTLTSCTTNSSERNEANRETAEVSEEFEDERTEVAEDLRQMREKISEQIQRVGDRMENAG
jgi:hypothetical protein